MKKHILDTSALISDPQSFKYFDNSEVIIPIAVLNELDKLKKQAGDVGRNARVCIRLIDEISSLGDISTGILIENEILVKVDATYYDIVNDSRFYGFGDPSYGDTQILASAYVHFLNNPNDYVVLISNDINLRIKSKSRGIDSTGYEGNKFSVSDLYSGCQTLVDESTAKTLLQQGFIDPNVFGLEMNLNECIAFESNDGECMALGRKIADNKIKFTKKIYPWGISAKNKEQAFAIDLVMDPTVDLVTLIGKAGTGKSLMVLASALELVLSKKAYDKFVIYRPIQPVGNDIGFLPGPQPLDAKIATPTGWSTMGEIQPNDLVIGSDGLPKKVIDIFPKGEKDVYKVSFSDGSYTECCEDHPWYTTSIKESQRKNGKGSIKSLKEIKETLKVYKTQLNNHKIPMVNPVNFNEQKTVIDPYIMGVLLGDGTLSEKYSVYFTTADYEIVENCQKVLSGDIICKLKSKSEDSAASNYSFINKNNVDNKQRQDNVFAREIKKLNLTGTTSHTKFIPDIYKFNSVENRISLLQGLMDTDGFISEEGDDVVYYSVSDALANDFKFLVQSLGGKSNITKKLVKYSFNNEPEKEVICNVVSLSLPPQICPVKLGRKVNRYSSKKNALNRIICDISLVGKKEVKCILIDSEDHLYATDQFILTHNTMEEKLGPWFHAIMDNLEFLLGQKNREWKKDLEMWQKKGLIEMEAITYIRGRSIPNSIILVDECQNLTKEEVKTILTRAGANTKIILTGDIEQIDNSILDATNNGLTYIIEKFKNSELAGHITLTQGERSRLASKAAEIL